MAENETQTDTTQAHSNVQFPLIVTGLVFVINGFLADLTAYLHAEIPGCEVSFAASLGHISVASLQ